MGEQTQVHCRSLIYVDLWPSREAENKYVSPIELRKGGLTPTDRQWNTSSIIMTTPIYCLHRKLQFKYLLYSLEQCRNCLVSFTLVISPSNPNTPSTCSLYLPDTWNSLLSSLIWCPLSFIPFTCLSSITFILSPQISLFFSLDTEDQVSLDRKISSKDFLKFLHIFLPSAF